MSETPKPPVKSGPSSPTSAVANNWNPFSARPGLDFAAFVSTVVAVGLFETAFKIYLARPMQAARLSLDQKQLGVFYAVWAIASLLGFFFIANTFIKRWATIYEKTETPRWMKTVARVFLVSPLLSIWATAFTLMYSREGSLFLDGAKRSGIMIRGAATLFIFHVLFLGFQVSQRNIIVTNGHFQLAREISMKDSFRAVLPGVHTDGWLPDEAFHIHVYPYLNPLGKLALSLYGDYIRLKGLSETLKKPLADSLCSDVPTYLGQHVPNCFFALYLKLASQRAFVSPAIGFIYETMYRQQEMKAMAANNKSSALTPMRSLALTAVSLDNMLTLLEPSDLSYDRREFLKPIGLLAFYGSPEIPAVTAGQDLQNQFLVAKFIPMIAPEVSRLSVNLGEMRGVLSSAEQFAAEEKIKSLGQRVQALSSDPLHSTQASPE